MSKIKQFTQTVCRYENNSRKEVPLVTILTKTCTQTSSPEFLSIYEYNSWKKLHVANLSKTKHLVRACTEKMMDHQYTENGARKVYSNNNQMKAYAECSPIDESLKTSEKFCPRLYLNFTRVAQFSFTSPRQ